MILRSIPAVHGKDISCEIGAPQDYAKNKENDHFPSSYDLKVPGAARATSDEPMGEGANAASPEVSRRNGRQNPEEEKDSVMRSATPVK